MGTTNITIREGGFYRTRNGQKVGPMRRGDGTKPLEFWVCPGRIDGRQSAWCEDGQYWPRGHEFHSKDTEALDIIAEWTDDEPDTPKIDLTAITTPFGLLPPETQAALKAHDGPVEIYGYSGWMDCQKKPDWSKCFTYRAAPQPKVETVTNREMYLTVRGCIACNAKLDRAIPVTITYTITNGVIDPASYRVEARG